MGNFEVVQRMELFYINCKIDGFCIFNRYLGISNEFYTTTVADEVRIDLFDVNSLSRNILEFVQFKIRSCFRTGARQRNPHTLILKLALVDNV